MPQPELLLLAGGIRGGSLNEKLVDCALQAARDRGLGATRLSLSDYRLPLFGADVLSLDEVPEALALKAMFRRHDAVIIASPEHNGSVTAMLKNALDWLSCPSEGEAPQAYRAFRRKPFGLLSASSSPFGGLRGLSQLRHILTSVHAWVVPEQLSVPHAHRAFDEGGALADPLLRTLLGELVEAVAGAARHRGQDLPLAG
ncbi:NADPH-dependent FMN reductase [Sphingopyxis sp.]|uniref:NADPH-dependent FMN reductase n=1 Tax=Sphingopyxis sp. TaxID=1908224 RepID=UPI0035B058E0